jgi:putative transposase
VVLDAWSGRVVGWSMQDHLRTELVLDALHMATSRRQPDQVIHHSGFVVSARRVLMTRRLR